MLFGSGSTGTPKILLLMFVGRPTRVSCSVRFAKSLGRSLLGTRDRILNGPKTDTHKSRKLRDVGNSSMLVHIHTHTYTRVRAYTRTEKEREVHLISIRHALVLLHTLMIFLTSSRVLADATLERIVLTSRKLSSTSLSRRPRELPEKRKREGKKEKE